MFIKITSVMVAQVIKDQVSCINSIISGNIVMSYGALSCGQMKLSNQRMINQNTFITIEVNIFSNINSMFS